MKEKTNAKSKNCKSVTWHKVFPIPKNRHLFFFRLALTCEAFQLTDP
jgi:hypothetical protein